ncbi:TlpA disulfide reductase family protein [Fervidibacter sacchari]|uniref:Thiol-disulfide isomerase/thioredoxin n=1 Tax=Candidatus Fervidibacter sacchari TaxID=1448929 RepID=A0ABT2ENP3_9BACT|nr:TlpA disulfide reductase family protein [Candidatus Fervidibacter sacchari]MCS3919551.1 thiol-disulfide isomerase/thioredoxin [Candidatus Fervidibacter sacchari]WKU15275.1 TlpA disulfide reductase family protein [Candidatus Fervidibacter sacchari]
MTRALMVFGIASSLFIVFALAALREGKPIPSFQANLLDGKVAVVQVNKGKLSVQIKDKKGNQTLIPKALVLDFWATWCPPCQVTSKWLSQLHRKYQKKGVLILAISIDEDGRASVVPFVKEEKTPYLVALDPRSEVANRFKVEGLPTIYVVNEKGIIVRVIEGLPSGLKELEAALRAAGVL